MVDDSAEKLMKINKHGDLKKVGELSLVALKDISGFSATAAALLVLKKERIERFVRALALQVDVLDDKQREELDRKLQSDAGVQLVAEYVERATRSISDWGRRGLAALLADELLGVYDK